MSGFSTLMIVDRAIAVAVAIRRGWLARQPSPKKCPASSTAITASFPACDRTESRTAPLSTYMTLVARSPCAKIVVADSYWMRRNGTPVQSTGAAGVTLVALAGLFVALAVFWTLLFPADRDVGPSSSTLT